MAFSIDGLVSGFDTTTIIEGLLQFQQNQIDVFNARKAQVVTRQGAFGGIESKLLTLRGSLSKLNRSVGSTVFDSRIATSGNESVLEVAADSAASTGSFSLTVNGLATAQQIASDGFESAEASVATGTFSIRVGDRGATDITIDESNNTLQGLANAINQSTDDVSASVIRDQTTDSYRLLVASKYTGESNQIEITSDFNADGTAVDFSGPDVQAAANAQVTLGSGPGAIVAEFETNQVDDLIDGVTLDLKSVSADPVTVNISSDSEPLKESIRAFVDEFNGVMQAIADSTRFDPETNSASPLIGNRNVSSIQNGLRSIVIEAVDGLDRKINRLSTIGVTIDSKGQLQFDESKLDAVLDGDVDGVSGADVRRIFGLTASSTNQGVEFSLGSTRTRASGTPYQVDIIQAAEQATISSTNEVATSVVIDGTNNQLQVTIDGQSSEELTLQEGTYTQQELAEHVQSVVNNSEELGNKQVTVSVAGNRLAITTASYGLDSTIGNVTGTAATQLGFDGTETDEGQDVAGRFLVNGEVETAIGRGQILTGDADNENTADLRLKVTLSANQVHSGIESEISVTRGITGQLDTYMTDILDPSDGKLKTIRDGFQERIDSIDASIQRVVDITAEKREYLLAEFAALESVISDLQNTGNFLSAQLSSLVANRN